MSGSPPLPRAVLTVGVTGHRPKADRLQGEVVARIEQQVAAILQDLTRALAATHERHALYFDSEAPRLRLISALAEGADRIGARAALAANAELQAVLPFSRDEYRRDFPAGEAQAEYDGLLADCARVFELAGERSDEPRAYLLAGLVTLQQCDVVLAIWDGEQAKGRGGTAEIVEHAARAEIPVIHVDVSGQNMPQLYWAALPRPPVEGAFLATIPAAPLGGRIDALVESLLRPPADGRELKMLGAFLAERQRRQRLRIAYPLLLQAWMVRRFKATDIWPRPYLETAEAAWSGVMDLAAADPRFGAAMRAILLRRYAWADGLAGYFAQTFRSGYVANFVLASTAVALALTGIVRDAWKPWMVLLELVVIGMIIANTWVGRRRGWHERWLDYRHLAERLRNLRVSALFGDAALRGGTNLAGEAPGWVLWYARATGRELGLPNVVADESFRATLRSIFVSSQLDEQIAYHDTNLQRLERLDHRLHVAGSLLFWLTGAAALMFLFALVLGWLQDEHLKHGFAVAVTWITAVFPALGAAIFGIRVQGDFTNVAERSERTAAALRQIRDMLTAGDLRWESLKGQTDRAAMVMLADLADWRIIFERRPLTLPA